MGTARRHMVAPHPVGTFRRGTHNRIRAAIVAGAQRF